jgi:hypothetical protein
MSRKKIIFEKYSIPSVRIEIRPSKILKGEVGVFSTQKLLKNHVVADASQFSDLQFIPWRRFERLDNVTKKKIMGYCPATPEGFFVPPNLNYISIAWHMNHSCNPNVGFSVRDDFVAMRDIQKGEELLWDYGFDETNPKFKMKCTCGAKRCRKVITGSDWKFLMRDADKYKYFSPKLKSFIMQQTT